MRPPVGPGEPCVLTPGLAFDSGASYLAPMEHLDLTAWLAQDPEARQAQLHAAFLPTATQSSDGAAQVPEFSKEIEAGLADVQARLLADDPPALRVAAQALADRGLTWPVVVRALVEHLHGHRATSLARWEGIEGLRDELIEEAVMLARGGAELWPEFILRYADESPDGVLAALIRHAGVEAIAPLVAVLTNDVERDPDSESEGFAPLHAATLLGSLGLPEVIEPLLDRLPDLAPGEPMVDALEAALHGFGDAILAPALARIEAAADDKDTQLAYWMLLARSEIDDDRIRDALVALLPDFPEDAAYGLSIYGDVVVQPAVEAVFDGLSDEDPVRIMDLAASLQHLGGPLSPERQARLDAAEAEAALRYQAEMGEAPAPAGPARRPLNKAQKAVAQKKKKVQRQMKKKSRPKKKK